MKKLLTIALALICMAVLTGLALGGVQKGQPPPPKPTGITVNGSKSNSYRLATEVMKGKVTKLNEKDNTFTVTSDGKEGTVSRATALKTAELKRSPSGLPTIKELKAFLESGELVEVTYIEKAGEPPTATMIKKAVDKAKETKLK